MDTAPPRIARLKDPARLDELAELYRELHAHQVIGAPQLAGYAAREPPAAWERRRHRYREWLAQQGSFLLTAAIGSRLCGYVLVTVASGYDGWSSGERVGEVRELVVGSGLRRRGVGSALLDAVESELSFAGVEAYRLSIVAGNASAERFYARRGLVPVALVMLGRTARQS